MNSIRVFQNSETLANELAICWHEQAKEAAKKHNWFSVILSGGNTAPLLYGKLAEPKWKDCIPWSCVHIFFADERCVPPYNKESNYKNIYDTLLRYIPVPDENIHRIKGEEDPEKEALRYSKEIQYHLNIKKAKLFDWALLGIGKDGHTASLFPGQDTLNSKSLCQATQHPDTAHPRITMTPIAINRSARITYHAIGGEKSEIVSKLTTHPSSKKIYPASIISGELFLDKNSASKINFSGFKKTDLSN